MKLDEGVYLDGRGADFRDQRCLVWSRGDETCEVLGGSACGVSRESLGALARRWQALVPPEELRQRQGAYLEAKTHGRQEALQSGAPRRLLASYVEEKCSVKRAARGSLTAFYIMLQLFSEVFLESRSVW